MSEANLRLVDVVELLAAAMGAEAGRERAVRERVRYFMDRSSAVLNANLKSPSRDTHDWDSLHRLLTLFVFSAIGVPPERAASAVEWEWRMEWAPFWGRAWASPPEQPIVFAAGSEEAFDWGSFSMGAQMRVLMGTYAEIAQELDSWSERIPGYMPQQPKPIEPIGWRIVNASGVVNRLRLRLGAWKPATLEAFEDYGLARWEERTGKRAYSLIPNEEKLQDRVIDVIGRRKVPLTVKIAWAGDILQEDYDTLKDR